MTQQSDREYFMYHELFLERAVTSRLTDLYTGGTQFETQHRDYNHRRFW